MTQLFGIDKEKLKQDYETWVETMDPIAKYIYQSILRSLVPIESEKKGFDSENFLELAPQVAKILESEKKEECIYCDKSIPRNNYPGGINQVCEKHLREQPKEERCTKCNGKELFDMVYQWGRVGVITDHTCNAFQDALIELCTGKEPRKEECSACKNPPDDTYHTCLEELNKEAIFDISTRLQHIFNDFDNGKGARIGDINDLIFHLNGFIDRVYEIGRKDERKRAAGVAREWKVSEIQTLGTNGSISISEAIASEIERGEL